MMTNTLTLADVERISGRAAYEHLARDLAVPILAGVQAQGDVIVVPCNATPGGGAVDVGPAGVDVVVALSDGRHAHTLIAPDGGCTVRVVPDDARRNGSLTLAIVDATAPVYLLHAEHGASGLAPGRYELRGQRVWDAAEARRVAD